MAQLIVRNIEDDVKEKLRDRAASNGRSMEEEARNILRNAVLTGDNGSTGEKGLGTRIAEIFSGDNALPFDIPEWRGEPPRPAEFIDDEPGEGES